MKRIRSPFFVLGALALLSLVSACGDSSDSAATTVAPTTTTAATTTTVAPTTTTAATTTTVAPTTTTAATEGQVPTVLSDIPRVTVEELKEILDGGEDTVVVDTRSESTYNIGHIAGAILETAGYFDESPRDQEIILYCA